MFVGAARLRVDLDQMRRTASRGRAEPSFPSRQTLGIALECLASGKHESNDGAGEILAPNQRSAHRRSCGDVEAHLAPEKAGYASRKKREQDGSGCSCEGELRCIGAAAPTRARYQPQDRRLE